MTKAERRLEAIEVAFRAAKKEQSYFCEIAQKVDNKIAAVAVKLTNLARERKKLLASKERSEK